MTSATIHPARNKGLRDYLGNLSASMRGLSEGLFAAHGGWLAERQNRVNKAAAAAEQQDRAALFALATRADAHSPGLAAELRYLANR